MRKSTRVCMLATMCAVLLVLACAPLAAFAKTESVLADDLSIAKSIILQTAEAEEIAIDNADYIVKDVYYSNEQWAGYVIDFTANGLNGYAIFFKMEGNLTLVEVSFQHSSAYINREGQFIYPSLGYYYTKINGRYYDAETMEEVDFKPTAEPTFYAACGKSDFDIVNKTTKYIRSYKVSNDLSDFYSYYHDGLGSGKNNCANVAGVIALNYWNKYFNNDLLKLSSDKRDNKGNIDWQDANKTAGHYMSVFYDYMKTNWFLGTGGTLPNNCYNGFERLIKENGYKVDRKTDLTYAEMRDKIDAGIPIFITSKDYYFTTLSNLPAVQDEEGNYETTITYEHHKGLGGAHTFVGFGYVTMHYYITSGTVSMSSFLHVADGWGGSRYFNVGLSKITSSAAIGVYK